jgi:voltage-gated potassium channel
MTDTSLAERWERHTEWPLAGVAIVLLAMYSVQVLGRPHGAEARVLNVASWTVWSIFVVDYLVRLVLASERRRWFVRHPFDLFIVALPLMQPMRLLRLFVLFGALHRAVGNAVRGRILLYTTSGVILLLYVGSLAIYDSERANPDAKINSFGEALWWSICTVTTVGYGDVYPITVVGRLIAVSLMIGGISLIGVVTASIASWIVERVSETDRATQAATAEHIDELRDEIRALAEQLQRRADPVRD